MAQSPCVGQPVQAGTAAFKLVRPITAEGHLHLGFYDTRHCFGTVYFGTSKQMKEISHWNVQGWISQDGPATPFTKPQGVPPGPKSEVNSKSVVEGVGWGAFRVGATHEEVTKAYGPPDLSVPGIAWVRWLSRHHVDCIFDASGPNGGAVEVRFNEGFSLPLTLGVKIGSTEKEVTSAYGTPDRVVPQASAKMFQYSKRGVLMWIKDGKVVDFTVFKPRDPGEQPGSGPGGEADRRALLGPWKVVRVEKGKAADSVWKIGETPIEVEAISGLSNFEKGGTFFFALHSRSPGNGGMVTAVCNCRIDPRSTPKNITLSAPSPQRSAESAFIAQGIYEFEGERVKIRLTRRLPSEPESRPKSFAVDPNSRDVLLILERLANAGVAPPARSDGRGESHERPATPFAKPQGVVPGPLSAGYRLQQIPLPPEVSGPKALKVTLSDDGRHLAVAGVGTFDYARIPPFSPADGTNYFEAFHGINARVYSAAYPTAGTNLVLLTSHPTMSYVLAMAISNAEPRKLAYIVRETQAALPPKSVRGMPHEKALAFFEATEADLNNKPISEAIYTIPLTGGKPRKLCMIRGSVSTQTFFGYEGLSMKSLCWDSQGSSVLYADERGVHRVSPAGKITDLYPFVTTRCVSNLRGGKDSFSFVEQTFSGLPTLSSLVPSLVTLSYERVVLSRKTLERFDPDTPETNPIRAPLPGSPPMLPKFFRITPEQYNLACLGKDRYATLDKDIYLDSPRKLPTYTLRIRSLSEPRKLLHESVLTSEDLPYYYTLYAFARDGKSLLLSKKVNIDADGPPQDLPFVRAKKKGIPLCALVILRPE